MRMDDLLVAFIVFSIWSLAFAWMFVFPVIGMLWSFGWI